MSGHRYTATVRWNREGATFTDRRYSRAHAWSFDGGAEVRASASPLIVRAPFSDAGAVDPEEAFVASVASCHMLFFLDYAAQAGYVVDSYEDEAVATMGTNGDGKAFVESIVLAPRIRFSGAAQPSSGEIGTLHHRSHDDCFIANSVKTAISVVRMD